MIRIEKMIKMIPASVDQITGVEIFLDKSAMKGVPCASFDDDTLPTTLTIEPNYMGCGGSEALSRVKSAYQKYNFDDVFRAKLYIQAADILIESQMRLEQAREIARALTEMCDYIEESGGVL